MIIFNDRYAILVLIPFCVAMSIVLRAESSGPQSVDIFNDEIPLQWELYDDGCRVIGENGHRLLEVVTTDVFSDNWAMADLNAFDGFEGKALRVRGEIRCEQLARENSTYRWAGAKLVVVQESTNGERESSTLAKYGTTQWEPVEEIFFLDPGSELTVMIGIEGASGSAWFRNFNLALIDATDVYPAAGSNITQAAYSESVESMPHRRGFMSPSTFTEAFFGKDMPEMKRWGANLLRLQLIRNWNQADSDQSVEEYLLWVRQRVPDILRVLDLADELDMQVVLDLHVPPGGRRRPGGEMNLFHEKKFAEAFLDAWKVLATSVAGHPALYGYDLLNEPYQKVVPADEVDYLELQYRAAQMVREIDKETPIIIESNLNASPKTFRYLKPLPLEDIIYQVHMYEPALYTHQGVGGNPLLEAAYPGTLPAGFYEKNEYFDRRKLKEVLQPVRDFQLKYGAKIYVGEFSTARWSKGGERYLEDCISIFEEYGWDWSYHAFREWDGWSLEHADEKEDRKRSESDTDRKKVLLQALERNSQ
ncbi:cellulase family glycosylhydrolase [Ruficoccus amylovorans]|uniref:Cellulase family glycosylhydrolase n=1 Tax=Ruficoccus amylovorans TaxID=1804625 RepID=A0A842HBL6_9BACT|nr:cellulase family glycosylhydrolase [Ruficoccus amylovorans]MBC2593812.1 cellulase family glycosylhydrolase [Ruficoccus amylovorans]